MVINLHLIEFNNSVSVLKAHKYNSLTSTLQKKHTNGLFFPISGWLMQLIGLKKLFGQNQFMKKIAQLQQVNVVFVSKCLYETVWVVA
jgi:hypothetical protein